MFNDIKIANHHNSLPLYQSFDIQETKYFIGQTKIYIVEGETVIFYQYYIMLQNTDSIISLSFIQYKHMQPITQTATHAINYLRSMVEKDADKNNILVCIDSLQSQLKNTAKYQNDILSQLAQIRAENKKIKHKSKALGKVMGDMEKNHQNLIQQLQIRNAICRKKSEQLLSVSDWTSNKDHKTTIPQIQKINQGIQCQILNWQLIQDLQQQNSQLATKLSHLQMLYEKECNQNNGKQLYIEELLQAFEREIKQEQSSMNPENIEELAKDYDNSTADTDQQEDDDYQLPTQLQKTDSRDTQDSDSPPQQIPEEDCILEIKSSWIDTIWQKYIQFCSVILRK